MAFETVNKGGESQGRFVSVYPTRIYVSTELGDEWGDSDRAVRVEIDKDTGRIRFSVVDADPAEHDDVYPLQDQSGGHSVTVERALTLLGIQLDESVRVTPEEINDEVLTLDLSKYQ